jgi:ABC-type polysaccharide/polyol phosphate transport system ATPase subunit
VTAVEVQNVSKYYALDNSQWMRMRRVFSPVHRAGGHEVCALRDVNFAVEEGEAFGIIGSNGSGKSTLLQIIAGILRPSSGSVTMNGRCSTLLELGSGFAPEFTGRQNVFLNGTILGLSEEELHAKFESIQRFADIGEFIDQPIRTYSTGMVLRLAFAVIAHSDPRILIVDEALAVGDVAFRQRCMRRIHELRAAGVTILFVSHDTGDVKALCGRCLWLDKGVVRGLGESDDVVARYLATTLDRSQTTKVTSSSAPVAEVQPQAIASPVAGTRRFGNGSAEITGVCFDFVSSDADGLLALRIRSKQRVTAPIAGFLVRNQSGRIIRWLRLSPAMSAQSTFGLRCRGLRPANIPSPLPSATGTSASSKSAITSKTRLRLTLRIRAPLAGIWNCLAARLRFIADRTFRYRSFTSTVS